MEGTFHTQIFSFFIHEGSDFAVINEWTGGKIQSVNDPVPDCELAVSFQKCRIFYCVVKR